MPLISIYEYLCDETRLRIIQLLTHGTWMIHALSEHSSPQLSKHLACLQGYAATSKKLRSHGASCPSKTQRIPK